MINITLPLIPEDSFFRRLPAALAGHQRLQLDAIVASTDIMSYAILTLREFAAEFGGDVDRIKTLELARAFGAAWTIVDQLHATRELFQRFRSNGEQTKDFMRKSDVAEKLRHKMDHLHQNLDNLAAKKRPSTPLLGVLGYVVLDQPPTSGGYAVTLTAGAVMGKSSLPMVNPLTPELAYPAYGFQLSAFGLTLAMEPALAALKTVLDGSAVMIAQQIKEGIDQACLDGHQREDLEAHGPRGLVVATRFKFDGVLVPDASPREDQTHGG